MHLNHRGHQRARYCLCKKKKWPGGESFSLGQSQRERGGTAGGARVSLLVGTAFHPASGVWQDLPGLAGEGGGFLPSLPLAHSRLQGFLHVSPCCLGPDYLTLLSLFPAPMEQLQHNPHPPISPFPPDEKDPVSITNRPTGGLRVCSEVFCGPTREPGFCPALTTCLLPCVFPVGICPQGRTGSSERQTP